MSFILDSSISPAWCFEDERTPPVMRLRDRVAADWSPIGTARIAGVDLP